MPLCREAKTTKTYKSGEKNLVQANDSGNKLKKKKDLRWQYIYLASPSHELYVTQGQF